MSASRAAQQSEEMKEEEVDFEGNEDAYTRSPQRGESSMRSECPAVPLGTDLAKPAEAPPVLSEVSWKKVLDLQLTSKEKSMKRAWPDEWNVHLENVQDIMRNKGCLLYTSPSPRD